jgi:hypothetical protein
MLGGPRPQGPLTILALSAPWHGAVEHLLLLKFFFAYCVGSRSWMQMTQAERWSMNIAVLEICWTGSANGEDLAAYHCGGPQILLEVRNST